MAESTQDPMKPPPHEEIPPYITLSYKILVPRYPGQQLLTDEAEDELMERLDQKYISLAAPMQRYMLKNRMYRELEEWREEITILCSHFPLLPHDDPPANWTVMHRSEKQFRLRLAALFGQWDASTITDPILRMYRIWGRDIEDWILKLRRQIIFETPPHGQVLSVLPVKNSDPRNRRRNEGVGAKLESQLPWKTARAWYRGREKAVDMAELFPNLQNVPPLPARPVSREALAESSGEEDEGGDHFDEGADDDYSLKEGDYSEWDGTSSSDSSESRGPSGELQVNAGKTPAPAGNRFWDNRLYRRITHGYHHWQQSSSSPLGEGKPSKDFSPTGAGTKRTLHPGEHHRGLGIGQKGPSNNPPPESETNSSEAEAIRQRWRSPFNMADVHEEGASDDEDFDEDEEESDTSSVGEGGSGPLPSSIVRPGVARAIESEASASLREIRREWGEPWSSERNHSGRGFTEPSTPGDSHTHETTPVTPAAATSGRDVEDMDGLSGLPSSARIGKTTYRSPGVPYPPRVIYSNSYHLPSTPSSSSINSRPHFIQDAEPTRPKQQRPVSQSNDTRPDNTKQRRRRSRSRSTSQHSSQSSRSTISWKSPITYYPKIATIELWAWYGVFLPLVGTIVFYNVLLGGRWLFNLRYGEMDLNYLSSLADKTQLQRQIPHRDTRHDMIFGSGKLAEARKVEFSPDGVRSARQERLDKEIEWERMERLLDEEIREMQQRVLGYGKNDIEEVVVYEDTDDEQKVDQEADEKEAEEAVISIDYSELMKKQKVKLSTKPMQDFSSRRDQGVVLPQINVPLEFEILI